MITKVHKIYYLVVSHTLTELRDPKNDSRFEVSRGGQSVAPIVLSVRCVRVSLSTEVAW